MHSEIYDFLQSLEQKAFRLDKRNFRPLFFCRSAAEFKGKCKTVKLFAKHIKVMLINHPWNKKIYTYFNACSPGETATL